MRAKKPASWLFAGIAAVIPSVIYFISRSSRGMSHPALVGVASVFDLTLTTSVACYVLLVRNGYASWFTVIAILLGGLRVAGFVLPDLDQQYLPSPKWIGVPLATAFIANVVRRFRRVPSSADALTRIRSATSAVIPYERVAKIVAAEIAVWYYALFSWRSKPATSINSQTFSCAEASGYGLFGTLLILIILCEGVPLHFALLHYSAISAWTVTALDAYGLLWAVAIIRAVRLRTIAVDDQWLKIRVGMIWEADIPRKDIVSCSRITDPAVISEGPGCLRTVVLNDPQYLIELSHPAIAVGLYGQRRVFTRIGIAVDRGEAFASALKRE